MLCAIEGVGVVSPTGHSLEAIVSHAPEVNSFSDVTALESFHTKRELRRTSHYCRLALLGANLALQDADRTVESFGAGRMGIVVATGYGPARTTFDFLDSIYDFGAKLASPLAFSTSVHNIAASMLSIRLGSTGPCLSVNQFESSFVSALLSAQCWLFEHRVDAVLVGTVDEYNATLSEAVSAALGYDEGVPLYTPTVDGAVFFLLTRDNLGRRGTLSDVSMKRAASGERISCLLPAGQSYELAQAVAKNQSETVTCCDLYGMKSSLLYKRAG